MFLRNQNQVRNIQWLTSNLWDVKIEGVPSPFSDWFPATDVSVTEVTGSHYNLSSTYGDFQLPSGNGYGDLTLTVIDDEKRTIYNWFKEQLDRIYGDFTHISPLESSLVNIHIVQLNSERDVLSYKIYSALPDSQLTWSGDSNISLTTQTLTFKIHNIKENN